MKRILMIGLMVTLCCGLVFATGNVPSKHRADPMLVQGSVPTPGRYIDCALSHYNTASSWFTITGWHWQGEIIKNFFDPADCPNFVPPNPYPFHLDSIWIPMYFVPALGAGVYTFAVDVECADLTDPDCPFPGAEVCLDTFQVYYNGIGNYLWQDMIDLDCCMDQPFFISLHWIDSPISNQFPGLIFDTSAVEECIQWYSYSSEPPVWEEWNEFYLGQIGLGNWVKILYGDANETCVPEICGTCEHTNPGDWCADPILPCGLTWTGFYNLCLYCNDYDLSPCTGWSSNAADMVFKVHFTEDNNDLNVLVTPTTQWDISLAVTIVCGDFGATSCLAGEDDNGAGTPESTTLTGLPAGDYFITVSGYTTNCGCFHINVSSNHQLPVELVSFAGIAGNREAKLSWTTASETNNSYFYVLRSNDSRNFVRVSGDITGTNSATGGTYSYFDGNLINGTTYNYKLVDVDVNGWENVNSLVVTVTPSMNSSITPDAYDLHQNYPNPFNPNTTISYDIRETGHVTLAVFDVLGREVMTLVNAEQTAASYTVEFDASKLSSGIYFYQLKVNDFSDLKKMVVLK